ASPHEMYTAPANAFVAGFLGSPPMNFMTCTVVANGGEPKLTCIDASDGHTLFHAAIGGQLADALAPVENGREVILGVRPEDLRTHQPVDGGPSAPIEATVEVVEFMGDEQFLNIRAGSTPLVARVEPDVPVK